LTHLQNLLNRGAWKRRMAKVVEISEPASGEGGYMMSRFSSGRVLLITVLIVIMPLSVDAAKVTSPSRPISSTQTVRLEHRFAKMPLGFEVNRGQGPANAEFFTREGSFGLYLTQKAAVLAMCKPDQGIAGRSVMRSADHSTPSENCGIVRMQVESGRTGVHAVGEDRLPGTVNYFIGDNPAQWRTGIPTYTRVRYDDILPGISLVYSGNHRQLEYDFIVSPGASPKSIRLRLDDVRHVKLMTNGDLEVSTSVGVLTMRRPTIYQIENGRRVRVTGRFAVMAKNTIGFRLGHYNTARPLIIDPVLVYSTFLGGFGFDKAYAIAVDMSGDTYIAGTTTSTNFPITAGAFQSQNNGGSQSAVGFITKMNAEGTALVYSTYFGGSGTSMIGGDAIRAIAVDSAGDAYVTGTTGSTDFPVTQGAFQATNKAAANQCVTAFVAKLNPTGTALVYSTYLGGSGLAADFPYSGDAGYGIAVDAAGNAYVTGQTYSTDFPVTAGAFQAVNNAAANGQANAFITKVNPTGTALVYSTYLGGSGIKQSYGFPLDAGKSIAVDSSGSAYVAGQAESADFPVTTGAYQTTQHAVGAYPGTNAFVAKLNPTGTALVYSTFLGGSSGGSANAIAINSSGNAYVAGQTYSTDFPVSAGAFQTTNHYSFTSSGSNAFVAKLNATGSALAYSTYLGGSGGLVNLTPTLNQADGDEASGIAIDSAGDAYVTGSTASSNFPVTQGAYQTVNNDQTSQSIGGFNAFVTELNPSGTALLYSTYLGGNGYNPAEFTGVIVFGMGDQAAALALDGADNVYVAGSASSFGFPVTSGAFQIGIPSLQNAFVAKLYPASTSAATILPTINIAPTPSPATSAQPVTITVTVSGPTGGATPTGTVRMGMPGYGPAQLTLSGGVATFNVPAGTLPASYCSLPLSPNYVAANYIPDATSSSVYKFVSGTAPDYVADPCFTVTPAATTLTPSQAASQSLSVKVAGGSYSGLPLPTGTVTLSTGSYTSAPATLTNNSASFTIPAGTLSSGFNTLNLSYSGDGNYVAMTNAGSALVNVTSGPSPGFTIAGTNVKLQPGATTGNTSTISVAPAGGFTGSVSLSATISSEPSGAVNAPTLSFGSTSPVKITGTSSGTATLTISTTAGGGCETASSSKPFLPWQVPGGAAFAMVVFIALPRRRWNRWFALVLLFVCTAGGITACGSGSSKPCTVNPPTTAGTYVISVTGTSGSTTSIGSITITVQ
jgi:hypothetical protein